jgi:GNAT superfamily N-acetyltransferase
MRNAILIEGGIRVQIRSWPDSTVPPKLRAQVVALREQAWPSDDPVAVGAGHDPALRPVSMLLVEGETVMAALDILSKEIHHAGRRYTARGLSAVVTDHAHRGKGYGRQLVVAARTAIRESGADLGIFTCDRPLRSFYESAGWATLDGAVLIGGTPEEPFPSDRFDKVVMAAFFSDVAQRHAESFRQARIELYPGQIDKLW